MWSVDKLVNVQGSLLVGYNLRKQKVNSTRIFDFYHLFEVSVEIDDSEVMKETKVKLRKVLFHQNHSVFCQVLLYQGPISHSIFQNERCHLLLLIGQLLKPSHLTKKILIRNARLVIQQHIVWSSQTHYLLGFTTPSRTIDGYH